MNKLISKKSLFLCVLVFFSVMMIGPVFAQAGGPVYVATIHPLAEILKNLTRGRAEVIRLLPPGASPHIFAPRPSDLKKIRSAMALFYVGPNLDREWVTSLAGGPKQVAMLDLLPLENRLFMASHDHDHNDAHHDHHEENQVVDPHFWTDPLTVRALLPGLVNTLGQFDPDGRDIYEANAINFADELATLHTGLTKILGPLQKKPLFLFHPSFGYFLQRYNLTLGGIINPVPGRETSPKFLANLIKDIQKSQCRVIFSEPQLPTRAVRAIAEAAGVTISVLDPLGGGKGSETYSRLLYYNASILGRALMP